VLLTNSRRCAVQRTRVYLVVVEKGARIDAGPVVVDVRLDDADVRTTDLVLKRGSGTESCG